MSFTDDFKSKINKTLQLADLVSAGLAVAGLIGSLFAPWWVACFVLPLAICLVFWGSRALAVHWVSGQLTEQDLVPVTRVNVFEVPTTALQAGPKIGSIADLPIYDNVQFHLKSGEVFKFTFYAKASDAKVLPLPVDQLLAW